MSTRRFPPTNEPLVNPGGTLSRNWYQALQDLTSNLVDVNFATPRGSRYFCNWSQADETRITLTGPTLEITNQGGADGARLTLVLIQGIGAPHLVTFTSETDFGAAGLPTLSTVEGARDRLNFVFNAALGVYDAVGFQKGFSV